MGAHDRDRPPAPPHQEGRRPLCEATTGADYPCDPPATSTKGDPRHARPRLGLTIPATRQPPARKETPPCEATTGVKRPPAIWATDSLLVVSQLQTLTDTSAARSAGDDKHSANSANDAAHRDHHRR
jgi:hypothetical protein